MAAKRDEVFREDNSLFGIYYGKACGSRGPVLTVIIQREGKKLATAISLDDKDFYVAYKRAAAIIAEFHEVGSKSKMFAEMADSGNAFLKARGLKLREVRYLTV